MTMSMTLQYTHLLIYATKKNAVEIDSYVPTYLLECFIIYCIYMLFFPLQNIQIMNVR